MRAAISAFVLPLLAAAAGAAPPAAPKPAPPPKPAVTVHEWGVFTAHDDVDVSNADVRAEWDALPDFVYGRIKGRVLPVNWGPTEVRLRPLIFFHTDQPADLRVRVGFPGGQPGVWWPGTKDPVAKGVIQPAPTDYLEWKIGLTRAPAGINGRRPGPDVPKGHWIEAARRVQAADVYAVFGDNQFDCDQEKFVYYDGLFPPGNWVKVTVNKDDVALLNRTKHPVFDVTVVDRRVAGQVRVGRLSKLEAGAEAKSVEMAAADAGKFVDEACTALVKQLVAAGLNGDEAALLAECRKADFFGTAGVQVFYRIPQEEYDRVMPLTVEPKPAAVVRVGLVLHPHCEPDLADRVAAAVKELDADDFAAREAAVKKLSDMGPAAFVHLARMRKANLPAEVRSRIELVLEKWEAKKAFGEK